MLQRCPRRRPPMAKTGKQNIALESVSAYPVWGLGRADRGTIEDVSNIIEGESSRKRKRPDGTEVEPPKVSVVDQSPSLLSA
jgi:hypothetical protein